MIPWIANNLDKIALLIMGLTIGSGIFIGFFFILDDFAAKFEWYKKLMYGAGYEREDSVADNFFGKAFLIIGIINITTPIIVVYGYMYYANITWAVLMKTKFGG
jgi:hypothetical protein